MLVPILIFLLMALLLQGIVGDDATGARPRSAYSQSYSVDAFSLTPDPRQDYVVQRTTSLQEHRDLKVTYYVTRSWDEQARRGYIDVRRTEYEVLRQHRDSLGRRCEAETLRRRKANSHELAAVCDEYQKFRHRIRG
jgi:DnaJ family protein B protein 12